MLNTCYLNHLRNEKEGSWSLILTNLLRWSKLQQKVTWVISLVTVTLKLRAQPFSAALYLQERGPTHGSNLIRFTFFC